MKHLLLFRVYEARASRLPSGLTPDQEAFLNACTQGTWSVNPKTGLVDVRGNFYCDHRRLETLLGISFGRVSGDFFCHSNQLTSLEGAPQTVGGDFHCGLNKKLTSLVGAPQTVDRDFFCFDNQLTSLVGAPQTVGKDFFCHSNQLTSLIGAPQTVDGKFYCVNNQLTSLAGAPQTVGGYFDCDHNDLTSLAGAHQTVDGKFYCDAFRLERGEWNPSGWGKILTTGKPAAQKLIRTLPIFDLDRWLQRLSGDLKKDGQVLLQLAALWEEPSWAGQRQEIEQRLSPEQLRAIKVLRTKLDYVNPWQGGVLEDIRAGLFEARASRLPSGLTPDQEAFLNACTQGTWSVNPETGLVDVGGNFDCSRRELKSLQGVSFGHVSGEFYCSSNQLTTLAGAPQTVDGNFFCARNQLTTLVGAPRTVGVDFLCHRNQLTSLEGAPQTVGGEFYCDAFGLERGEWNPSGWLKILSTGNYADRRLILTLPIFDPDRFLQKLSGDLKKDGQVLLQLADLWEEPGWAGQRREIEQRLSPEQLRAIKVLRTKLDYVNPWQGGVLED